MHILQDDDTVRFEGQGKVHYGLVKSIGKKYAMVYEISTCEIRKIAISRLTYVPPVTLDKQQITKLCRYEISWSGVTGGAPDIVRVVFSEPFTLTLNDLSAALHNIRLSDADNTTLYNEWFEPLYSHYCIYLDDFLEEQTPDYIDVLPGLPNRARKLEGMLRVIEDIFSRSIPLRSAAASLIREINSYLEDEKKPVSERNYKNQEKEEFLLYYDSSNGKGDLNTADDTTRNLYRRFVNDLISNDNKLALKIKGEGCCNGSIIFERDPAEAYRLIKRLFDMAGEPNYALWLGELCFSGDHADGMPEYEEAFRYLSIAASGGILRAMVIIARMFALGLGVPKNTDTAWRIVEEVYSICEQRFLIGDYNCKFADAAFYKGRCMRSGKFGYHSATLAYESFLQARLAVRKRREFCNDGDDKLADDIQAEIDKMFELGILPPKSKTAKIWINSMLYHHLHKYRRMVMRIRRLKSGDLKLTFSIEKFPYEHDQPVMFITETNTGYCDAVPSISVKVSGSSLEKIPDEPVLFNSTDGRNYFMGGTKVITIDGDYTFTNCAEPAPN